jgi:hypothetical protein
MPIIERLSSRSKPSPDLLATALGYAARGWSIIAVKGKIAAGLWKPFQELPADEPTLRRMFGRNGITGLAVILGSASSGLACRDFDLADAYHAWAAKNPDDAIRLPTVRTPRAFHVYGRLGEEIFVDFGDGELRADSRHYVLLPPSRHPSGQTYAWLNPLPPAREALPLLPPSLMAPWGERREEEDPTNHQPKQPIACVPKRVIEDAIEVTLPDGPGQRNRKIFDLARRLKGITGMEPQSLKPIVVEWHRRALPAITTKDFGETWSDFQVAWQRVKNPHGTRVDAAYAFARQAPRTFIDGNNDLGALAAMCKFLSEAANEGTFFLACRTVERLFRVPRMTAWRWLQSLQFYGIIEAQETGRLKNRQATTWRYTA